MFLIPVVPVVGVIAFMGLLWVVLWIVISAQSTDLDTDARELDATTQFMATWHRDPLEQDPP